MAAISEHNDYIRQQPQPITCPITRMSVIPSNSSNHIIPITNNYTPNIIIPSHNITPTISYPSRPNNTSSSNHSVRNNNYTTTDLDNQENNHLIPRQKKKYLITQFFTRTGDILSNTTINLPLPPLSVETETVQSSITNSREIVSSTSFPTIISILPTIGLSDDITHQTQRKKKAMVQSHLVKKPIANDSWGSSMESKDPNSTQIFFQNINGLTSDGDIDKWKGIVKVMHEKECDIFGLAETNTNWRYYDIKNNIDQHCNEQFNHSRTSFSDNRFNPNSDHRYLPGGCLQSCTQHWTSRVIESIHDPRKMGRWTGQRYRLNNMYTLTVMTAYRPCTKNSTNNKSSSIATYRQQSIMMIEDELEFREPRTLFIDDIIETIKTQEAIKNNFVILMLDANETIYDTEGGLRRLMNNTTLVDTFSRFSDEECCIPTYTRESMKIDYIFTSINFLPYVTNVGCNPFYLYTISDHRSLFLDFSNKLLDTKVILKKPDRRFIGTKNEGIDLYNYKQYVHRQFINHRIYDKSYSIFEMTHHQQKKEEVKQLIHSVDNMITEIVLAAERTFVKPRHATEWSV